MSTPADRARAAAGMAPAEQPGKELSLTDRRIADTRSMEAQFADAVASGLSPKTLVRDAITAIRATPKLAETERSSFFGALMTAAQLGLRPNVASLGHGWILPYWNRKLNDNRGGHSANWILGYQGMVELAYRSKLVTKITTHTIYSNEPHKISWGTEDTLLHEPIMNRDDRGDRAWHYAVVWLATGGVIWNAITEADALETMERHAARDRNKNIVGPWRDDYEPMARKTALRGLWRFMPKTPALSLALESDGVTRQGVEPDPVFAEVEIDRPGAPDSAAAASEPPAERPAAAEPPAAPPTPPTASGDVQDAVEQHVMIGGEVRDAVAPTQARGAYLERIAAKHVDRTTEAVLAVVGEAMPLQYLTTAELRAASEVEL